MRRALPFLLFLSSSVLGVAQGVGGRLGVVNFLSGSGAPSGACGKNWMYMDTSTGNLYTCPSAWTRVGGNGTTNFANIASGTNTAAAMVVGSGASLAASGSGSIAATSLVTGTANTLLKSNGASPAGNSSVVDDGTNPTQTPNGLDLVQNGLGDEYTVDTGGVTENLLACRSSSNKVVICPAGATTTVLGVARSTVAATGTVKLCFIGKCNVVSSNNFTAGNWAIPSATVAGEVDDSGSTSQPTTGTQTFLEQTTGSAGAQVSIDMLTPDTLNASGGGTPLTLEVNGTVSKSTANFNGTTPAAGANNANITFQTSVSGNTTSISGEIPNKITVNGTTCTLGGSCSPSATVTWDAIGNPAANQTLSMGTDKSTWQGNGNAWPLFYFDPANGFGFTMGTTTAPVTAFSTTAPFGLEVRGGGANGSTPITNDADVTLRPTNSNGASNLRFTDSASTTNTFGGVNFKLGLDPNAALHQFFHLLPNNGSTNGYDWQWRNDGSLCINPAFGCQFTSSVIYSWGDSGNSRVAATFDANGNSISTIVVGNLQLQTTATTTSATVTKYNNISTAGRGVPPIYGATLQKTETAADTNVLTFTPPAAAGSYRLSFVLSVSAASAAVLGWTATWKDSNGNAQSPTNLSLTQSGAAAPGLTFTLAAAGNLYGEANIDTDNSATAIVIKLTFTGTSFTGKASATIEQLQ